VRGNIVAAVVSVVLMRDHRVGLVRWVRFAERCEAAVEKLFQQLPKSVGYSLSVVAAGIATTEQFAQATEKRAVVGRLRSNCKLRGTPPPPNGKRGRDPLHEPMRHPGWAVPEVEPDEEIKRAGEQGELRRRWQKVQYEGDHDPPLEVLRVDDPAYEHLLLVGTTAWELTTAELRHAYPYRWPVETLFYSGAEMTATEKP
jgi:hypothetical protein